MGVLLLNLGLRSGPAAAAAARILDDIFIDGTTRRNTTMVLGGRTRASQTFRALAKALMPGAKIEKVGPASDPIYLVRATTASGTVQRIALRPPALSRTAQSGQQGAWTVDVKGFGASTNKHDIYKLMFTPSPKPRLP